MLALTVHMCAPCGGVNLDTESMSLARDAADVKRHLNSNLDRHISTFFHLHRLHRRLSLRFQRRLLCPRSYGAWHSETDVVAIDDQLGYVGDLDDGRAVWREIPNTHRKHILSAQGRVCT